MLFVIGAIGSSDFWIGFGIGAVALFLLIFLFFVGPELLPGRWNEPDLPPEVQPVTGGVLICDYVDERVLATVAKQKKIDPDPVRLERGTSTSTGGGVEGGKRLRARLSRDRTRDERSYYELSSDYNALLHLVLETLDREAELIRHLDTAPYSDPLGEDTLDAIVSVARDKPQIEAARDAVRALRETYLRDQKAQEFEAMSNQRRFVLVESDWRVTENEDGYIWLELTQLRRSDYGQPMEMPEGVSVVVRVPAEKLTDPGRNRIVPGAIIGAGVFGTIASYSETLSRLFLTPVAVFARVK